VQIAEPMGEIDWEFEHSHNELALSMQRTARQWSSWLEHTYWLASKPRSVNLKPQLLILEWFNALLSGMPLPPCCQYSVDWLIDWLIGW
jgi:hypothetical protein